MKNTFGNSITVTLFGESHGPAIGAVIDGITPGIEVVDSEIKKILSRRAPAISTDTQRKEEDNYKILSGVFNGKTTGTPLCIIIPNEDTDSKAYEYGIARPSHADYAASCKYHGFEDYRGGGHFSGRVTAAICAIGGILMPALYKMGIKIGTHIKSCAAISDIDFDNTEKDIELLKEKLFPTLCDKAGEKMQTAIADAGKNGDSVGGIIETVITGIGPGLGEPWFDSLEGVISHAMFSIGGIKGIEFGNAFYMSDSRGSIVNDEFRFENGKIVTATNNNGGINGGLSNGMPVLFRCAVKPTPSISCEQNTVNFITGEEVKTSIKGRHDSAIIRRICPVIESMTAIVIADMIATRYGTDAIAKEVSQWSMDL